MNVPIPNVYHPAGTLVNDGSQVINTISANSNVPGFNNIWSHMPDAAPSVTTTSTLSEILGRLERLELENKCLRLKIACMEGKFDQEEVSNIRKMLISEDEASRTLAESIIDNA